MNNGLRAKYIVQKIETGEAIENCFVLRPEKDLAAVAAIRAYAEATDNEILAADLLQWVGEPPNPPLTPEGTAGDAGRRRAMSNWISVKDKLPEKHDVYLVTTLFINGEMRSIHVRTAVFCGALGWYCCESAHPLGVDVTHWMPLPEPPEEGTP